MKTSFYRRFGLFILLLVAAWLPAILIGAFRAADSNENIVSDWLPPHFAETKRLKWFVERFGEAEMLVISWEGCTLDDPRANRLAGSLRRLRINGEHPDSIFRNVFTGSEMLEQLTAPPFDLRPAQALDRLKGWLVGSDERTTCVVAQLSKTGKNYRHEAVDSIYQYSKSECGLDPKEIHMAGPSIDSVAIDRTSHDSIQALNFICWGTCLVVAVLALRSLRIALIMFLAAVVCQYLSVAIIYYSGTTMNSILMMVASLVFVLSVSAAVHLVNYYRDAIADGGIEGAAGRAVRYAWAPCWMAAATTALGMASLTISRIKPIHTFGMFAAIGVLAGLTQLMFVLPSALERWPDLRWANLRFRHQSSQPEGGPWRIWAGTVIRLHPWISLVGVALLLVVGFGVTKIETTVNLHDMFVADSPVIQDYEWIQQHIGPMVPVDVVLHIPRSDDSGILERMQLVERIRQDIAGMEIVGGTLTAATFGPKVPFGSSVTDTLRRTILKRKLERHRGDFEKLRFLYIEPDEELWRISVRVVAQTQVDYGLFLDELEERVAPLLKSQESSPDGITGVRATLSGGIPLVNKAQQQLLQDLIWSFVTAFILVGFTMMIVLRDIVGGTLAMIPNVVPSALVFGLMGWLGIVVDIGAMMTASAALGIAVDDTLHFVVWFRRGLAAGYDRKTAVRNAFQRCGTAMTQTSLICGLGLLAYSMSPFVPISRFSWMMFMMLFTALIGDLILLPALLVGPLGRFFEIKSKNTQTASDNERQGDLVRDETLPVSH